MTDRMIQVPASLIERAAVEAERHGMRMLAAEFRATLVRHLASQPTPTAEPSMCGNTLRTENYVHECVEDAGHTGKHMSVTGIWWTHDTTQPEPPRPEDMAPRTPENPEGWPYSTEPANAKRCGEAHVGYEGGEGSCEYLPNHAGRHWSARWGSWSL